MDMDRIERDTLIEAPLERVWEVLTRPEHAAGWFGGASAEIDACPGGAITFRWREHGTFHARVERIEPPHHFSYRWALLPDEPPRPGNSTLVEFSLTAEGPATRLRVVESGFRRLEVSDEARERHLSDNRQGWDGALEGLRGYAPGSAAQVPR
jgi:uncharacterized protein YndB with AHSA1/START domain